MIGLFDSGVGGVAALARLCRKRPGLGCLYMADTAFLPYGEKDAKTLAARAEAALAFFRKEGAEAVLFACGTLSAVALPHLCCRDIPVFGVLTPAADAATRATRCGRVLVLATEASVASGAYPSSLALRGVSARQIACPRFVPLCEGGHTDPDDPLVREAVAATLPPGCEGGADTILLGCTHYAWLAPALRRRFPEASLIDAAASAADACLAALSERAAVSPDTPSGKVHPPSAAESTAEAFGGCRFVCTGNAPAFARAASSLLHFPVRASSVSL